MKRLAWISLFSVVIGFGYSNRTSDMQDVPTVFEQQASGQMP